MIKKIISIVAILFSIFLLNSCNEQIKQNKLTLLVPAESDSNLHHFFPKEFKTFFQSRGIDIDEYTMLMPEAEHSPLHTGKNKAGIKFNDSWQIFIENNPNASRKEIQKESARIWKRYFGSDTRPFFSYSHTWNGKTGTKYVEVDGIRYAKMSGNVFSPKFGFISGFKSKLALFMKNVFSHFRIWKIHYIAIIIFLAATVYIYLKINLFLAILFLFLQLIIFISSVVFIKNDNSLGWYLIALTILISFLGIGLFLISTILAIILFMVIISILVLFYWYVEVN